MPDPPAPGLHRINGRLHYRSARPGPGWHAHGTTTQRVHILRDGRLTSLTLHKQRWLHVETGRTQHDRPDWLLPWSAFDIVAVFAAAWAWASSPKGLLQTPWPWASTRPSRRTVQRWWARLQAEGLAWQVAIREVLAEQLAPRPLKEMFPAGLPPPGGGARHRKEAVKARQLTNGITLLQHGARQLSIPHATLLSQARRRLQATRHR